MNQDTTIGLLYPALQKFYSALKNLEQFNKGNDFFDNISSLDNFFSEYRNITFVLQKSIAHTEYMDIYNQNKEKFLLNETCKWFVDKRNEVLKEHPFHLEKRIVIKIYSPYLAVTLSENVFTIENDVKYSTLIESLKDLIIRINHIEVFFSVEFSFYEIGQNEELYDSLIAGIVNMKTFLFSMKDALNEDCKFCKELLEKIDAMRFYNVPKNMLFIDDYVYYCKEDRFEKALRMEVTFPIAGIRMPLSEFCCFWKKDTDEKINPFDDFILMHIILFQEQRTLMPTFMIIYDDETFELKSFHASIKTTMYRKINEIAQDIKKDGIKAIFLVSEMYYYKANKDIVKINYNERIKQKTSELLCFYALYADMQYKSYSFDCEQIDDMRYIVSILKNEDNMYISFLSPILEEFKKLNN